MNAYQDPFKGDFEPQIEGRAKQHDFTPAKEEIWKRIPDDPEHRAYIPPDKFDDEDDHIFDGKAEYEPPVLSDGDT